MYFFMITPQRTDPLFEEKKHIVESVSAQFRVNANYAPGYSVYSALDIKKSIQLLKSADFFIADLSYERPSCYFEVGFVQSIEKPIDLIALTGTIIHQVLGRESLRFYKDLNEYEFLIKSIISSRMALNQ